MVQPLLVATNSAGAIAQARQRWRETADASRFGINPVAQSKTGRPCFRHGRPGAAPDLRPPGATRKAAAQQGGRGQLANGSAAAVALRDTLAEQRADHAAENRPRGVIVASV